MHNASRTFIKPPSPLFQLRYGLSCRNDVGGIFLTEADAASRRRLTLLQRVVGAVFAHIRCADHAVTEDRFGARRSDGEETAIADGRDQEGLQELHRNSPRPSHSRTPKVMPQIA